MQRKVPFVEGEFFHVYNRGVDKRKIFFTKNDKEHFFRLLKRCNVIDHVRTRVERKLASGQGVPLPTSSDDVAEPLVDIVAYCLMDNHFHLIVQGRFDGSISKFMSKLGTAFSMHMNKKYNRTGPLMCRPFRSKHVAADEYFRWLFAYIHLNPVDLIEPGWKEKGIKSVEAVEKFLKSYRYSSYTDYVVGVRPESIILAMDKAKTFDVPIGVKKLLKEFACGQGDSLPT